MSDEPTYQDALSILEGTDPESVEAGPSELLLDPKEVYNEEYVAKITVVETVYHRTSGDDPTQVTRRFARVLLSDEEPYQRRKKLGKVWEAIDLGWVEKPSVICIYHVKPRNFLNPSPVEAAAQKDTRLQVVFGSEPVVSARPHLELPPGEDCRLPVTSDIKGSLWIRSFGESLRYQLHVFPE